MQNNRKIFLTRGIQTFVLLFILFFSSSSSAQSLQWAEDYTVEPEYDRNNEAYAIAIDVNGNVYVTGMSDPHSSLGCTTDVSIATLKYNPSGGTPAWINRYSGCSPNPGDKDAGNSIATVTIEGNTYIYVTGRTYNNGNSDFVTIKYNQSGSELWDETYGGSGYDEATHIEVDVNGNAYITGKRYNVNNNVGSDDYVTIKYDFDGNQEWVMTYNGTGNGSDRPTSLSVAGSKVYVTGTSAGDGTGYDIVTIAYDIDDGTQIWLDRYNSGSSNDDYGNDIAADISQGVYVTGNSGSNFAVIKYDNDNGREWVNASGTGVGNSIDIYRDPCLGNGPCYTIHVFATGSNGLTVGYDEDNNTLSGWPETYGSNNYISIGIDGQENVYVTGQGGTNYITVMYDAGGNYIQNLQYQHSSSIYNTPREMEVDYDGNIFITGSVALGQSTPTDIYYTTIKYEAEGGDQLVLNGNNNTLNTNPQNFSLLQNYPNPFNPSSDIKFDLPQNTYVTVKVYNALGEEVARLVNNEWKTTGRYSVKFDGSSLASGIYFYSINAGSFRDTKKMVLIK